MSDRYVKWGTSEFESKCRRCGSIVATANTQKHDAFHDRIDRLAAVLLQRDREDMESASADIGGDDGERRQTRAPEPTTAGSRVSRTIGIISATDNPYGPVFDYTVYDKDGNEGSTGTGPTVFGVLDMLVEGVEAHYGPTPEPDSAPRPVTRVDEEAHAAYRVLDGGVIHRTVMTTVNVDLDKEGKVVGVEFLTWPPADVQDDAYRAGKAHVRKVIVDRLRDLQSCTKDDDCQTKADILLVVLDDLDYEEEQQTPPERAETYQPDTEPPAGSVVRCEGCGNVYVHKPHGWMDTDDGGRGLAWVGLAAPSCGPLRVIYTGGAR